MMRLLTTDARYLLSVSQRKKIIKNPKYEINYIDVRYGEWAYNLTSNGKFFKAVFPICPIKTIFSRLCLSKRKARELSLVVADLRHCSGTEKFQRAAFWSRKNFLVCPEATACRCPKLYRYRLLNARRTSWIGGGCTSLFWTLQQKRRKKVKANFR